MEKKQPKRDKNGRFVKNNKECDYESATLVFESHGKVYDISSDEVSEDVFSAINDLLDERIDQYDKLRKAYSKLLETQIKLNRKDTEMCLMLRKLIEVMRNLPFYMVRTKRALKDAYDVLYKAWSL